MLVQAGTKLAPVDVECCCVYGACCINGACSIKTAQQCSDAGGIYHGDNTACTDDLCGCGCAETLAIVESLNQLDVSVHFHGSDTCNDIDITLSNTWIKTDLEPLPYNTFKFTCLSLGYIYFRSFPVDYTSPVFPDPGITCHAGTPDSGNSADFEISLTPNNPPMDCTNALLSVAVSASRECHIGVGICDVSFFENSPGLVIPWADLLGTHYISFVNNAYVTGSTTVDLTLTFS